MFVHSCCCIWFFLYWVVWFKFKRGFKNHLKMLWNIWKGKRKGILFLFSVFSPPSPRPACSRARGRLQLPRLGPSPASPAARARVCFSSRARGRLQLPRLGPSPASPAACARVCFSSCAQPTLPSPCFASRADPSRWPNVRRAFPFLSLTLTPRAHTLGSPSSSRRRRQIPFHRSTDRIFPPNPFLP
jgi:hypothetical protein